MASGEPSVPSVVLWSLLSHLAIALVLLAAQRIALRRPPPHFRIINEFLLSFLWASWSLEGLLIGNLVSPKLALLFLFLRLLLLPYIVRGAYVSPCSAFFKNISQLPWPGLLGLMGLITALQLAGMVCGVAYSLLVWTALGSTVSDLHGNFMANSVNLFLQVSPLTGFFLELVMTFLTFLPSMLMKPAFSLILVESLICTYLVYLLGDFTGAFMNPVSALTFSLASHWSDMGVSYILQHLVVYWMAPFTGTMCAVGIGSVLESKPDQYKLKI